MHIETLKLAFFSPTGTSAIIARSLATGLNADEVEEVDITLEADRQEPLKAASDELLVIALPVYGGRVPLLIEPWLRTLQLDKTPVFCAVVYGNRAFEDALVELSDIVTEQGGVVVGGAAFIGEHSFSNDTYPVAVDRPDAADLAMAEELGRKVRVLIEGLGSVDAAVAVDIPGDRPYKERNARGPMEFIEVSEACVECGTCAEHCPVGAIGESDLKSTDPEKCILCCACIKICPENARSTKPGSPVDQFAKWLNDQCAERKAPECFL